MIRYKFLSLCSIIFLTIWVGILTFWNAWVTVNCPNGDANCNTEVSVTLYNSYSWSIQFNSWTNNRILSGGNIWIWQPMSLINITSSDSSTFTLLWWPSNSTWTWTGSYTIIESYNLWNEGLHTLQAEFSKSWEFLFSNTLDLFTDYSAPSKPIHNGMPNDTLFTGLTGSLTRSNSVDTGVWLAWYYLYISMNPSFVGITPIRITWSTWNFHTNDLPRWTVFYKTVAVDYLDHESTSTTSYFHNQIPTNQMNWGWSFTTNPNTNTVTPPQEDIIDSTIKTTSYIHPVAERYSPKKRIFNNQTKALKPYLISNFTEHWVANRILPDVMPQTGAWDDIYEPITKDTIEQILQESMYNKWTINIYFYLFRALLIIYIIEKRLLIAKFIGNYYKKLDK
jgi:hypothetical protein